MTRFRLLFAICAVLASAALLGACGGDDDGGGGDVANEDPQKVLDRTFSGEHESVDSGDLSVSVNFDATGDEPANFEAQLNGPFENQGEKKVPKFALDATAEGSGQGDSFNFEGGLISTGDSAFVSYKGSDYEVDQALFDRFQTQVETAAEQQGQNEEQSQQLLKQLGLENPEELLTNLTNEGETDVEGAPTAHVSGDLDVDRTVEVLQNALQGASALGALGGANSQVPSADELDQLRSAVSKASFDVYSGTEDDIMRRLTIALVIEPPDDSAKVDIGFDLTIGAVNEAQVIEAPSNAKPFDQLLEEIGVPAGALDQLGGLGALGGGSGGGSATPALPGTTNPDQAQEYLNCVGQATSAADLQECQSLAP